MEILRLAPVRRAQGPAGRPGFPHSEAVAAEARHLWETTCLASAAIAAAIGVSGSTVTRWARAAGWTRPPGAPCASDLRPTARAQAWRRHREAAGRVLAMAETEIAALEAAPRVDLAALDEALGLLRLARETRRRGVKDGRSKRPRDGRCDGRRGEAAEWGGGMEEVAAGARTAGRYLDRGVWSRIAAGWIHAGGGPCDAA